MFTQKWRQHWGLQEDPFACEDADKDMILAAVDPAAVHSGFERVFGNPRAPAPGIVFGEKGSGKSGLRLMMRRWLDDHNQKDPDHRIFCVDYIEFDSAIEQFQRSTGTRGEKKVLERWEITDHLDSILSLGVTQLADEMLDQKRAPAFTPKQRTDFLILVALYYSSPRRSIAEALRRSRALLHARGARRAGLWILRILGSLLAVAIALAPTLLPDADLGDPRPYRWGGAVLLVLVWGWTLVSWMRIESRCSRAAHSVRVLQRDSNLLREVLGSIRPKDRQDYVLPKGSESASRYDMLGHLLGLLRASGYSGAYVLMDRIDEPSLLSGSEERMRRFLEKILDIKLLQFPNLALKLFLPIEMESIYRSASPEDLKRMRLDKSNLIPELKWTGQELYEIANQRLRASLQESSTLGELSELFAGDLDFAHLRETLHTLGTPRYAFGFLSALFQEYVRELPNELPPDDPRWKVGRSHFDVIRAAWIDRTGLLRRSLN